MTWFTKWALRNKAALAFSVIASMVFGIISYFNIPMELMPEADQPYVTVSVVGNGIDAVTMDEQVTKPIEKSLAGVKGKRDVLSETGNNFTQMTLTFESNTNLKEAKQQVQEAVSTVNLPVGVMKPFVVLLNTSQIPVVYTGLTFEKEISNKELNLVENDILPKFKQIKGVGNVMTYGGKNQQVLIKLDMKKLTNSQIPLQNVYTLLQGRNASVAVGEQTLNNEATSIIVTGKIEKIEDLKNLQINASTKLQDVAEVTLEKDTQSIVHMNGKDFIQIVVQKDSTSNAVSVGTQVDELAKEINKEYKGTLKATVFINLADTVLDSINSMTREVLIGALFATLIILLFLRSFRMTLITIISIPLSLCITMLLLSFFGVTLNILTLGGIAVSVGRLVDDSIVVVENIYRRKTGNELTPEFLISAVKEVSAAITSSTLTTVAVFLPMGLVSGGLRDIVLPFAITISCSLLASLFVSLTVVPVLSARMMKNVKIKDHKQSTFYPSVLRWSLNHKWLPILLSLVVVGGSVGLFVSMPKGSVDQSDSAYITVLLRYKNGTPFEEVKSGLTKMEGILAKEKGVKNHIVQVGNNADAAQFGELQDSNQIQFMVFLDEDVNSSTIVKDIRKHKEEFDGAVLTADTAGLMGPNTTTVSVDVLGDDEAKIEKAANIVEKKLKSIEGVLKVENNDENTKPTVRITVDSKLVNAEEIAQSIGAMLKPAIIGNMKIDGRTTTVKLGALKEVSNSKDLEDLQIMLPNGMTALSEIAKIEDVKEPGTIYSKNGHNYLQVSAAVDPEKMGDVTGAIQKELVMWKNDHTFGDGTTAEITGSSMQSTDDLMELGKMALFSIGLVFLILLITLKSFRASIAILFSLPLAAIGSLLGLVISKSSIDVSAGIGMLMLIGIVVTNAIVLVDRIRHNEEKMNIREAIIEAGIVRLRPILMTALATVFAMVPLLFANESGMSMNLVSKGLAVVVISGLTLSTLLTLIVIPTFYELFHFKKAKKQRQNAVKGKTTENPISY
ncbi:MULTISPECIES: efflux RND transporter permease subunit [unclassified Bacillus (in: firmicutes)]|uniref:efflux RND transporter permease subunit n=1 Tax=unclassified Bacillus (in: firmicutes) TaxID=185979 RepID=UPI0008F20F89|nr:MULTISPECIES: efflux RND transporter permease subunit [unclassified Bacillus (in: firmicutes)]SFA81527.1 hydrophobic/amphiphilic exporter-1, HAE1 family [Bacillus sp. UNCCL13]SFQ71594.1 hydrophobic/amphiphilic exporter-1, HAE1 family [Bacillus sp. cl95]